MFSEGMIQQGESSSRPCCLVLDPSAGWIAAAGACSGHRTGWAAVVDMGHC